MKYKKLLAVTTLVLLIAVLGVILVGCGDDAKKHPGNETVAQKPDIKTAIGNYEKETVKRSEFTADFSVIFYQMDKNTSTKKPMAVTERLALTRIANEGQLYFDGKISTNSIDDAFLGTYKLIRTLMQDKENKYEPSKDEVYRYLSGGSWFDFGLGYAADTYNLKMSYCEKDKPDSSFWGATDNASINKLLKEMKVDAEVNLSEYLMATGLLDLTDASEWLAGDAADKYLSPTQKKYIYNLFGDSEKIYNMIFGYLENFLELLDAEEYAELLDLYKEILPYVKKWLSVEPATVDAYVTEAGLPESMYTSMQVNLNIKINELDELLKKVLNAEDASVVSGLLRTALTLANICGSNGESGTLGISFKLELSEKFSYSADACSFANADQDMFLAIDAENEKRYVFKYDEEE